MSRPHKIGRKRTAAAASIGEVGYTFRKKFDAGWYTGRVVEIRPGAGELHQYHIFDRLSVYVCIEAFFFDIHLLNRHL
jgi:hypothetical protein